VIKKKRLLSGVVGILLAIQLGSDFQHNSDRVQVAPGRHLWLWLAAGNQVSEFAFVCLCYV